MFKSPLETSTQSYEQTAIFVENIFDTVKKAKAAKAAAAKSLAESKLMTSYDYSFGDLSSPVKKKKPRKNAKKNLKVKKPTTPKKKTAMRKPRVQKDSPEKQKKIASPAKSPRKYTKRVTTKVPATNADIDDEEAAFILSSISQRSFDSFYNRLNSCEPNKFHIPIELSPHHSQTSLCSSNADPVKNLAYYVMLDHNYWIVEPEVQPVKEPEKIVESPVVVTSTTTPTKDVQEPEIKISFTAALQEPPQQLQETPQTEEIKFNSETKINSNDIKLEPVKLKEVNNNKCPTSPEPVSPKQEIIKTETTSVKKRWLRQAASDMKTPVKKRKAMILDDALEVKVIVEETKVVEIRPGNGLKLNNVNNTNELKIKEASSVVSNCVEFNAPKEPEKVATPDEPMEVDPLMVDEPPVKIETKPEIKVEPVAIPEVPVEKVAPVKIFEEATPPAPDVIDENVAQASILAVPAVIVEEKEEKVLKVEEDAPEVKTIAKLENGLIKIVEPSITKDEPTVVIKDEPIAISPIITTNDEPELTNISPGPLETDEEEEAAEEDDDSTHWDLVMDFHRSQLKQMELNNKRFYEKKPLNDTEPVELNDRPLNANHFESSSKPCLSSNRLPIMPSRFSLFQQTAELEDPRKPFRTSLSVETNNKFAPSISPSPFQRSISETSLTRKNRWSNNHNNSTAGPFNSNSVLPFGSYYNENVQVKRDEPMYMSSYNNYRTQKSQPWDGPKEFQPNAYRTESFLNYTSVVSDKPSLLNFKADDPIKKCLTTAAANIQLTKPKPSVSDPRLNPSLQVDGKKEEAATPKKKVRHDQI